MGRAGGERLTAKAFLYELRYLDKRIEDRLEEAARLRSQINRATSIFSDMPRGGKGRDWTDTLLKACELERRIMDETNRLIRWKAEARAAIDLIDEANYRRVLEMRYVQGRSWRAIAREMNYSERAVFYLHVQALKKIVVPQGLQ